MGVNACNVRLLPKECKFVKGEYGWKVEGYSNITERNLIQALVENGANIQMRKNPMAYSGWSYLLNGGIEMLIGQNNTYVNKIEFRIGLSWVEEGLRECFEVIKQIEATVSVSDWVDNSKGEELSCEEIFVRRHLSFISERKEIFDKGYSKINGRRLLESEIMECYKKCNRKIFKFKSRRAMYKKVKVELLS